MTSTGQTGGAPGREPNQAELVNRFFARAIDTIIFGALSSVLYPFGVLAAFVYALIADGLMDGRSPGKRIVGLRVIAEPENTPATIGQSAIRNLPLAFVLLLAMIPLIGWVLFPTVGLLVLGVEIYLAVTEERGRRAGDILAKTRVIAESRSPHV
jgi:uncharacterized RDD family membrane protein YckC